MRERNDNFRNDNLFIDRITGITLLSLNEYKKAKSLISSIESWWWWLRSSDNTNETKAYICNFKGEIRPTDVENRMDVRPALKLDMPSAEDLSGKRFWFGGHRWTVLSEKLALCDEALCKMPFRSDRKTKNANKYSRSDIRKYLQSWLASAKQFDEKPLDAALVIKPYNIGLSREEIEALLEKFPKESKLFHIIFHGERKQASGFSIFDPEIMNEAYFASIIDAPYKKSPDGIYEHRGRKIYFL